MKKEERKVTNLFARYLFIVLAGLGNLYIFYKVLTPLTIKTLYAILTILPGPVQVSNNVLFTTKATFEIVPACVAGAAFYLLLILIFSTPNIHPKKRIKVLLLSFVSLFVLNIGRLLLLIGITNKPYFALIHWILWHIISVLLVVGIWFAITKKYNIKEIPIYSDIAYLGSLIQKPKKSKRAK